MSKFCSVDGCEGKHYAKNFCAKHWNRVNRHGDPHYKKEKTTRKCSIEGCNKTHKSKSFCEMHYARVKKHGDPSIGSSTYEKHGMTYTSEYHTWQHIKARCNNPNSQFYYRYGGRGIYVCDRWMKSFNDFYKDMGDKPSPIHQIDRINNDGPYSPENCEWVLPFENARNSSQSKLTLNEAIEIRNVYAKENISYSKLAKKYSVSKRTILRIIKNEIWKEI